MSSVPQRLKSDGGFTLVELLVAMTIGTIVLMAAFMTLDRSVTLSNEVADRSDALQRGRQAMELLTRELRSQVCLGEATEPIIVGLDNEVSFYVDLTDGSNPNTLEKRRLALRETAPSSGKYEFVEDRWTASGVYPDLVYTGTPRTRVIGTNVKPVKDGATTRPVFKYYAFKEGGTPGETELLPTPLTTESVAKTVRVDVAFVSVTQRNTPKDSQATTLENQVYVRSADPSKPKEGARCL